MWPNTELGAEMVKWRTKRFKRNYIICCNEGTYQKLLTALRVKMNTYYWELEKERRSTDSLEERVLHRRGSSLLFLNRRQRGGRGG